MAIKEIIKMGHPLLLEKAKPITDFDTPELHKLIDDMVETMEDASGAGLAAPQVGEGIQLVIFGHDTERYPEDDSVPFTVLINGTGKITLQLYSLALMAIVNIPLSIFFSKNLDLGVSGVILATTFCLLPYTILAPIQCFKILTKKDYGIWSK